ncbi:MAG: glycosyltransferase family 4 protein [Crocinitomicaceae bacterium]|nr:glycosyltransferase family 4 protein [Crocinitomicaceae bacterium]
MSKLLAEKFKENTGFQTVVIPNFIEKYNSPVHFQSDKTEILSVGDMNDGVKNFSGLIEAFSEALKINSRLNLTIIGGGPDENKILHLIEKLNLKNNIQFLGRQNHEFVLKQMHLCHFYICNSNNETFGMTVAEALRAGKPVISTRCGGPEEFLHEHNSLLTEPGNNENLSESILQMTANLRNYDADKIAAEMEEKFGQEIIRKNGWNFFNYSLF